MTTATKKSLPAKLSLSLACMGGNPHLYASNVQRNGDYAAIAEVVGASTGEVYLGLREEFNTPAYREQCKAYLRTLHKDTTLTFADEQLGGAFITTDEIIKKSDMPEYDAAATQNNPSMIHSIYVTIKQHGRKEARNRYKYAMENSWAFPYHYVIEAIADILEARNASV